MDDFYKRFSEAILNDSYEGQLSDWKPCQNLSLEQAIEVYRDDYRSRLTQALGYKYEATWSVMGDDDFFDWCLRFIKYYPSKFEDLGKYGKEFPEFLKDYKDFSFIYDLAKFERLFDQVFHMRPQRGGEIDLGDIENKKWEFIEPLIFFNSSYRVTPLWLNRKESQKLSYNLKEAEYVILYKSNEEVELKVLTPHSYKILNNLFLGQTLAEVLEVIDVTQEEISKLFEFLGLSGIVKN
ncbi:MAG: DNA-binding domain-containing protein [Bacteriovoracaceae bacterium]